MIAVLFLIFKGLLAFAFAQPICSGHGGNTALVVIDMQPYFVTRGGNDQTSSNKSKVEQVTKEQITAIKDAERAHIPIVFIEYDGLRGTKRGDTETNSALKAAAANYKDVKFFKKSTDGVFEKSNSFRKGFVNFLTQQHISTLIITGANGGACVFDSIKGALDNNCSVVAFTKGIADFNYKDFIYPYVGRYSKFKSKCKHCTFNETLNVDFLLTMGQQKSTPDVEQEESEK